MLSLNIVHVFSYTTPNFQMLLNINRITLEIDKKCIWKRIQEKYKTSVVRKCIRFYSNCNENNKEIFIIYIYNMLKLTTVTFVALFSTHWK